MKAISLFLISALSLSVYADNKDPLYIDSDSNHKFSLKEQVAWTDLAIMEYESLKTRASIQTKRRLNLIISSDINEDGLIDETEKRLIKGRLASICKYYETILEKFYTGDQINSYNLKRLKYKYPNMIPGYDLADPFIERTVIKQQISPIYF